MKFIKFLFLIALIASHGCYAQENNYTKAIIKNSAYLKGDLVKIPLTVIRDWPFIDGEVNGVKGLWMFDTGNSGSFRLHSKRVAGIESKTVGSGFVASGQKYQVL